MKIISQVALTAILATNLTLPSFAIADEDGVCTEECKTPGLPFESTAVDPKSEGVTYVNQSVKRVPVATFIQEESAAWQCIDTSGQALANMYDLVDGKHLYGMPDVSSLVNLQNAFATQAAKVGTVVDNVYLRYAPATDAARQALTNDLDTMQSKLDEHTLQLNDLNRVSYNSYLDFEFTVPVGLIGTGSTTLSVDLGNKSAELPVVVGDYWEDSKTTKPISVILPVNQGADWVHAYGTYKKGMTGVITLKASRPAMDKGTLLYHLSVKGNGNLTPTQSHKLIKDTLSALNAG